MNQSLIKELKKYENVTVIAVSKYHTKEDIDAMAKHGLTTFGENKVQDFLKKYDPNYSWHMIGHLQTNKVKYIIGKVDMIQSLDSIRLAQEIEKQASKHDLIQNVLIQVKISDDAMKTGLPIQEVDSFIQEVSAFKHISIRGFMCVASNTENREQICKEFDTMHSLYLTYKKQYTSIDTLSMGMSQDYKLAIEHGSNMIRIGHALFD